MKRSAVITMALLLATLAKARGVECDNATKVTENRRVVLPERVHSSQYARRGLWLQNRGDNGALCAVGAETKRRLLPGEVWEEKASAGYLSGDLETAEELLVILQNKRERDARKYDRRISDVLAERLTSELVAPEESVLPLSRHDSERVITGK